jgi:HD-GYP domain-containing protein (c-di-GMP phosphodiesterase class II)/CHASE2 domain-containing sensor protein
MAPLYGAILGMLVLLVYWPGIVSLLPGLGAYAGLKPLQRVDLWFGDALHARFAQKTYEPGVKICVIGVTQESITRDGPISSWSRDRNLGQMAERLAKANARVTVFDVFFPDSRGDSDGDARFAASLRRAGNVILPRYALLPQSAIDDGASNVDVDALPGRRASESRTARDAEGVYRAPLSAASERIYAAASAVGHINVFIDRDAVARRIPAAIGEPGSDRKYLPISVVAALACDRLRPEDARLTEDALLIGSRTIPLDPGRRIPVNYQSLVRLIDTDPSTTRQLDARFRQKSGARIELYSYDDVANDRVPPETFRDAVVLIGQLPIVGSEDVHLTPLGRCPGVLIHALMIETLLNGDTLRYVSPWTTALLVLLVSAALGAVIFTLRIRGSSFTLISGGFLVLGIGAVVTLVILGLLRRQGLIIDATPFLLAIAFNLVGGIAANAAWLTGEVGRRDMEMDLLLVAGKKHVTEMAEERTPRAAAIPGASQIAITASLSLRSPEIVAETFWTTVPCDGVALFIIGQSESLTIDRAVYQGFPDKLPQAETQRIGLNFAWETLKNAKPVARGRKSPDWRDKDAHPDFRNLMGVPIMARGQALAVAVLFNKRSTPHSPEREFTDDHLRFAAALRYQAAALLENARRYQLEYAMFDGFARSLAKAVDFRDRYTRGHSERVAEFSAGIASELGLTDDEVEIVQRAATLHDLGKIGVNDGVLRKPGRLSDDEFALIRAHAANGYEILKAAPSFEALLPGIRHHHERYDGRGYPDGLSGSGVPLLARIISLADSYDAMTTDRIYRKALPEERARSELRDGAGTQFDPVIVEAMLRYLDKRRIPGAPPSTQAITPSETKAVPK